MRWRDESRSEDRVTKKGRASMRHAG